MATKRQAIEMLRTAGLDSIADEVSRWRNKDGGHGGWDAYFGKKYPEHRETVGLSHHSSPMSRSRRSSGTAATQRSGLVSRIEPFLTPTKPLNVLPDVIVHADWSQHADGGKRQYVRVERRGRRFVVSAPSVWQQPTLESLVQEARAGMAVLAGFDFAIGLPAAYARALPRLGGESGLKLGGKFPELIRHLPREFFIPQDDPLIVSWRQPFFPRTNAGWASLNSFVPEGQRKQWLARRILGDASATSEMLLRSAERRHAKRRTDGSPIFLLTAGQVGRASISGWNEIVIYAAIRHFDAVRLWPFDGALRTLVKGGRLTLVETYPGEFYAHLGIGNSNKGSVEWRRGAGGLTRDIASEFGIRMCPEMLAAIDDGFGSDDLGEDRFDAMVGAVVLTLVALGHDAAPVPPPGDLLNSEGWICGCPV